MTDHKTNIQAFRQAALTSGDSIVKAYCGLVAIELVLKQATGLKDHNVPSALKKFAIKHAIDHMSGCKIRLNALATQLSNRIDAISVNGVDGNGRAAPTDSYPYIRYTRHLTDGWPSPSTSLEQATELAEKVAEIRAYLASKFDKAL
ncbi:hypothetical protein LMG28727_07199 [Paraburkholderia kirstenboschensis]|uniref:hypothetical protein n=1 Tax=Paraburkholderia kirstenboschensis TaxID=1245436 RepID=UPI000AF3CC41|nr:hypothetical protein [Paraburkholderia kirstenboschensis]CAD6560603.1 hypothetical protein LMG28727_07199 [Paraburkholderia kirstenboschensis]